MKEKKDGLSKIKPTSFYSNECEKIKLNWFCYELSIEIYDNMKRRIGNRLKRNKISDEALAEFSINISKGMKDIVLQKLSGRIKNVYFSHEMIERNFPDLDDRTINRMLDIVAEVWDEQLSVCEVCPTRCISEKDAYCTMFDDKYLFT
jgi:uncharacterized Fe-S radical SAM superfamily protein PflX